MAITLITNAKIATSSRVFPGSLLLREGRIAGIYPADGPQDEPDALRARGDARLIDAGGHYLLPGGVDPHTHFDLDVGFTRASDDFYTGSVAAAWGGTTTVIDHMAFAPEGCSLLHMPGVYHQLAKDAVIDYGFHGVFQHVDDQVLADMARLMEEEGITSGKVYMTYDSRLADEDIFRVLERAKALGMLICAHCENHGLITLLRRRCVEQGHTAPIYHARSRPAEAEAEAVFRFAMLARAAGMAPAYVVHLSTALGLGALQAARDAGQVNLFAESCPQYLFLEEELYEEEGLKYIMCPPLRKPADRSALWQGLARGQVDTLGTDHCPFFLNSQKQRGKDDFTRAPSGAPGVELRMPLLFSEGFMKGRLSLPEVVRLCCTRPAELFGIAPQKGDIALGADADLVLFDETAAWTVAREDLHERVDYTPYEGMALTGRPVLTISRGEVIVENGVFRGEKGRGQYLRRGICRGLVDI